MASLTRFAMAARFSAIHRQPFYIAQGSRRMAHAHASEYHNIPFDYSNRRRFAAKCVAYMGFGFALPFVAVGWQWYKPGGYKNPS
ncbi:hypothetical protein C8R47DRAFT_1209376 [Mycena vitilis]|nr:hypothetical protein C8R47DRAFT_1209376 [Mycena vitilis]